MPNPNPKRARTLPQASRPLSKKHPALSHRKQTKYNEVLLRVRRLLITRLTPQSCTSSIKPEEWSSHFFLLCPSKTELTKAQKVARSPQAPTVPWSHMKPGKEDMPSQHRTCPANRQFRFQLPASSLSPASRMSLAGTQVLLLVINHYRLVESMIQ